MDKTALTINISVPGLEQAVNDLVKAIAALAPAVTVAPAPAQPTAPVQQPTPQAAAPVPPVPAEVPAPAATAPVVPTPAPAPVPAPAPMPAPITADPAPATTGAAIPQDAIIAAGVTLVEAGRMDDVVALLQKYGVPSINQLQPAQFDAFAADLRALGAQI